MNSFTDDFFSNLNIKSTSTKKKKKEYDVDNFTSSFFEDYDSSNNIKTESSYDNDFYDEYNAFVDELNGTRVDYYNTLQKKITKKNNEQAEAYYENNTEYRSLAADASATKENVSARWKVFSDMARGC